MLLSNLLFYKIATNETSQHNILHIVLLYLYTNDEYHRLFNLYCWTHVMGDCNYESVNNQSHDSDYKSKCKKLFYNLHRCVCIQYTVILVAALVSVVQ